MFEYIHLTKVKNNVCFKLEPAIKSTLDSIIESGKARKVLLLLRKLAMSAAYIRLILQLVSNRIDVHASSYTCKYD